MVAAGVALVEAIVGAAAKVGVASAAEVAVGVEAAVGVAEAGVVKNIRNGTALSLPVASDSFVRFGR